jgi:hypothetical protein
MAKTSVSTSLEKTKKRLNLFPKRFEAKMRRSVVSLASEMDDFMYNYAPWNDITGLARDVLSVRIVEAPNRFIITMYYNIERMQKDNQRNPRGKDYAQYLEGYLNLGILLDAKEELRQKIKREFK